MALFGAIIPLALAALLVYLVPAIVAFARGARAAWSILALNILMGWTIVGWIILLVWALRGAVLCCGRCYSEKQLPADPQAEQNLSKQEQQKEPGVCQRCGSLLTGIEGPEVPENCRPEGYCSDPTCPYSDHLQNETWTEG